MKEVHGLFDSPAVHEYRVEASVKPSSPYDITIIIIIISSNI